MRARTKTIVRVVIAGGGTAGHVAPAIAVADRLTELGCQVAFIGTADGPEHELAEQAGYQFFAIAAGKLRRYLAWQNVTDIFRLILGFWQSRSLLVQYRPSVVFAKGGYVSVPVALAAHWLGIPVVAHESDVVIGLANRLTARQAKLICTGFPTAAYPKPLQPKLRYTGSPVRQLFLTPPPSKKSVLSQFKLAANRPIIVVIGGSQGAQRINDLIFTLLPTILGQWQIVHIVGPTHAEAAEAAKQELPRQLQSSYHTFAYISEELPNLLSVADLVISRAGANTLAELALLGKPTILIPLSTAASDHQNANAQVFAKKGAAIVLDETELTATQLQEQIAHILADTEERHHLSRAIKTLSSPEAANLIAEIIYRAA